MRKQIKKLIKLAAEFVKYVDRHDKEHTLFFLNKNKEGVSIRYVDGRVASFTFEFFSLRYDVFNCVDFPMNYTKKDLKKTYKLIEEILNDLKPQQK